MKKDFVQAEKAYLFVEGGVNAVVDMYKKHKEHTSLLRFVKEYNSDALNDVYKYVGQALQREHRLREAEKYYLCCEDWMSAVSMYKCAIYPTCLAQTNPCSLSRAAKLWDDVVRVAQTHGDPSRLSEVGFKPTWIKQGTVDVVSRLHTS